MRRLGNDVCVYEIKKACIGTWHARQIWATRIVDEAYKQVVFTKYANGMTSLHLSAIYNDADEARLPIRNGADVNTKGNLRKRLRLPQRKYGF